jgi:hypothetical protein
MLEKVACAAVLLVGAGSVAVAAPTLLAAAALEVGRIFTRTGSLSSCCNFHQRRGVMQTR